MDADHHVLVYANQHVQQTALTTALVVAKVVEEIALAAVLAVDPVVQMDVKVVDLVVLEGAVVVVRGVRMDAALHAKVAVRVSHVKVDVLGVVVDAQIVARDVVRGVRMDAKVVEEVVLAVDHRAQIHVEVDVTAIVAVAAVRVVLEVVLLVVLVRVKGQ